MIQSIAEKHPGEGHSFHQVLNLTNRINLMLKNHLLASGTAVLKSLPAGFGMDALCSLAFP
jgi:hypothetical protein